MSRVWGVCLLRIRAHSAIIKPRRFSSLVRSVRFRFFFRRRSLEIGGSQRSSFAFSLSPTVGTKVDHPCLFRFFTCLIFRGSFSSPLPMDTPLVPLFPIRSFHYDFLTDLPASSPPDDFPPIRLQTSHLGLFSPQPPISDYHGFPLTDSL